MKLYLLRPVQDWTYWYDKAFGFVVAAESELSARYLASKRAGDEGKSAWLSSLTKCEEIAADTTCGEGIVIRDFWAA